MHRLWLVDLWEQTEVFIMRHARKHEEINEKLDMLGMLTRLASLISSLLRRPALGRAIVVLALATTYSFASAENIKTVELKEEKPVVDVMNLKLYLHNKINDWDEFECANELGIRESNWRVEAVNKQSGAYGIFQHMSDYAANWDGYRQLDKHIEYIAARYDNSWCKALNHLLRFGWH